MKLKTEYLRKETSILMFKTDKEEEKGEKKKKLKKANAIVDKEETYKHAK